ncbi:hypothetical protein B0H13DRAFT_2366281 [Mycena leptocephala]|nr:hypothetical protein B0H13DRAFT_2366281 [Mycena leptocephala]
MNSNPSPGVPSLPDGEKFDGVIGFRGWKTKIVTLAKARGMGSYLDGTLSCPPAPAKPAAGNPTTVLLPPEPTPVYSLTPSKEEWIYRDAQVFALVVLNVKNPEGLGMKLDGTYFWSL